ncbi:MAG TPA: rhodanese-like domain-containing protein [Candidatus Xenobia bacterium]|jgi:rhodanese-related sulfurtransferase
MAAPVDIKELDDLLDAGAQLVDVLPARDFDDEHLPRAISLPLEQMSPAEVSSRLERHRPVVTYCYDYQ